MCLILGDAYMGRFCDTAVEIVVNHDAFIDKLVGDEVIGRALLLRYTRPISCPGRACTGRHAECALLSHHGRDTASARAVRSVRDY